MECLLLLQYACELELILDILLTTIQGRIATVMTDAALRFGMRVLVKASCFMLLVVFLFVG